MSLLRLLRPVAVLAPLALLLPAACSRSQRSNASRAAPKANIYYLATGTLSEPGERSIGSLLDVVADRTGTRISLHAEQSWTRPETSGRSSEILDQLPTPDLVLETRPHFEEWVRRGYYTPLDDLLHQLCPAVWKQIPQDAWDANRVDGHVYGIPVDTQRYRGYWIIRADIGERLGLPEIDSFAALLKAARAIAADGSVAKAILGDIARPLVETRCRYDFDMRQTPAIRSLLLYFQGNDGTVHNLLEELPADVKQVFTDVRGWSQSGVYVAPRVGAPSRGVHDLLGDGDWFAAYVPESELPLPLAPGPELFFWAQAPVVNSAAGARADVLSENLSQRHLLVDLCSPQPLAIPAASGKKELTLRLLYALCTRETHDLLNYGIEGTCRTAVGRDEHEILGTEHVGGVSVASTSGDGDKPSHTGIRVWSDRPLELVAPLSADPEFVRLPAGLPSAYRDRYIAEVQREDGSEADLLAGFTFIPDPVSEPPYDYIAKYQTTYLRLAVQEVTSKPSWSWLRAQAHETAAAFQHELRRLIDVPLPRRPLRSPRP